MERLAAEAGRLAQDAEAALPDTWVLGTLVCVGGSVLTSLGLVLQKRSHSEEAQQPALRRRPYHKQAGWWLGFGVFMAGQLCNVWAMGLTPAALVACLGSVALVANVAFARALLGEKLPPEAGRCIVGILAGGVLLVWGTPHGAPRHWASGGMWHQFLQPRALGWTCGSVSLGLFLAFRGTALSLAGVAAICAGWCSVLFRCLSLLLERPQGGLAAQWAEPSTWAFVPVALLAGVLQVHWLNRGLQAGRAVLVVPTFYALGMLAQLVAAALYFDGVSQFWAEKAKSLGFLAGVLATVRCTVLLGRAQERPEPLLEGTELDAA